MRHLSRKYAWADEDDISWTVAVIADRTEADVVRIYGGDPGEKVGEFAFDDAWVPEEDFGRYFHLQVLTAGRNTVAIEPNGLTGKQPEIARRASADGGSFFSVYWSVNGVVYLTAAEDGRLTAAFDAVIFYNGDLVPEWVDERDFDADTGSASICMALMEQRTGVAFQREWLTRRLPTYRIPDPYVFLGDAAV
jgi:uncharacterized protein (UPF0248 family)